MIKVGITGGIGSGKTTACKVFETLNVPVFYTDDVAKKLYSESEIMHQVITLLGADVYENDQLIYNKVAKIVFADKEKLQGLNKIIHPAVAEKFAMWIETQGNKKYVLKEAAILFESGAYKQLEKTITVIAPIEKRIKRVMLRDKVSSAELEKRIKAQWTDEERIRKSDFIINNDEENLLIPQVLKIHETLSV
jgi:dephospho-CoA kinase